ncbi:MAG: hypothetical protein VYA84_17455 [Planctomycetota bacterium]|nr:hypothetical protein [Planctomycetota bacterium]
MRAIVSRLLRICARIRAVLADTFGSGSFGSGLEAAARPVLLDDLALLGDLAVERVVFRPFELAKPAFSFGLLRLDLAVGDAFTVLALVAEELDLRRKRRWTFLISSTSSAFLIPCHPGTP